MNGIEKITQRIAADAQAEITQLLSQADEQAERIAEKYQQQAQRERSESRAKNEKAAQEREERLVSVAQMESRKALLAARQNQVEAAFDQALDQLCQLPREKYIAVAAELLIRAAEEGKGQVIFSQADRETVGQAVVDAANAACHGTLALSPETRNGKGGFLLVNGSVEINCSFDTLVRLQRSEMAGEVAGILFAEK
jgi:V/A-type H+-transporting ATPase subunit E